MPVQTFLPYSDFARTAQVLDRLRLGKQRVEVVQLLRVLTGVTAGWAHHPATLMWRGHERMLGRYGIAMCDEWIARGYRDTCRPRIVELSGYDPARGGRAPRAPWWLGDDELHRTWQSLLLRKNAEHYGPLFPDVPDDLEFAFPAPTEE